MSLTSHLDHHEQHVVQEVNPIFDTMFARRSDGVLVPAAQGQSMSFIPRYSEISAESSTPASLVTAGGTLTFHLHPSREVIRHIGLKYTQTKVAENDEVLLPGPMQIEEVTIRGDHGGTLLQTLRGELMMIQKRLMTPKDEFTKWATESAGFADGTDNMGVTLNASSYTYQFELSGSFFEQVGLWHNTWHKGFLEIKVTFRASQVSLAGATSTTGEVKLWTEGVEVTSRDHDSFEKAHVHPKEFLIHDHVVQEETLNPGTALNTIELRNFVNMNLTNIYVLMRADRLAATHDVADFKDGGLGTTIQLLDGSGRKMLGETDPTMRYVVGHQFQGVENQEGVYLSDGTAANCPIVYNLGHPSAHFEGRRHGGLYIKTNFRIQFTCATDPGATVVDLFTLRPTIVRLHHGKFVVQHNV